MNRFQPDGQRTVTPRLLAADVAGLVTFLKEVSRRYVADADDTYLASPADA